MIATLMHDLVADLRPTRRPARLLFAGAIFWLASAVFHVIPLALDGWDLYGAVSFRKPVLFGLSFGLMLASAGWILDRLPDRPRLASALAWTLLVSSTLEVALITAQAWRGRASHFNSLQPVDEAVFVAMGIVIGLASLSLAGILLWSLIERPGDRLIRVAVIGGMLLMVTGLGLGQWVIDLGISYADANDAVPDTVHVGERGVAKFPHGVAVHGIQVFILAAVGLRHGALAERGRRRVLHLVVWSYTAILVFACAQTVSGRAPIDLSVWSAGMAVSMALLIGGLASVAWALVIPYRQERAAAAAP